MRLCDIKWFFPYHTVLLKPTCISVFAERSQSVDIFASATWWDCPCFLGGRLESLTRPYILLWWSLYRFCGRKKIGFVAVCCLSVAVPQACSGIAYPGPLFWGLPRLCFRCWPELQPHQRPDWEMICFQAPLGCWQNLSCGCRNRVLILFFNNPPMVISDL